MSGMYSDYLANKINDHINGIAVYTPPTQMKVGLYTARGSIEQSCAGTNFTAVSGGGYVEVNMGIGSTNWNASAVRAATSKLLISMGTPSADWGTVIGYTLKDQSGNLLWWSDLTNSRSCPAGAVISIPIAGLGVSLPQGA
jgi:hypothetical protein